MTYITCSHCGNIEPLREEDCEAYCEDCGTHGAQRCLNCGEPIDQVYA